MKDLHFKRHKLQKIEDSVWGPLFSELSSVMCCFLASGEISIFSARTLDDMQCLRTLDETAIKLLV